MIGVLTAHPASRAARADALDDLIAVYATKPTGYPTGEQYARPDTSVPFRWHFYNPEAIAPFEDAKMDVHVAPYNALEGTGVKVGYRSPVKFAHVGEHVTEGKQALRVNFPEAEVKAGKAIVFIQGVEGPRIDNYSRMKAVAYWSHYRWFKCDVFNPSKREVCVRVGAVPLRIRSGASTIVVKTVDAVVNCKGHSGVMKSVPIQVTEPKTDVTLYFDNARMEQEVPSVLRRKGRMFQFAARSGAKGKQTAPVLWPGFTPVERPNNRGLSFRSYENGIVWGRCDGLEEPFRVDLPNGRYGVHLFATPNRRYRWSKGADVKLNGTDHALLAPRTEEEVRREALSGETWDYRPGACVWQALVRRPYFPPTNVLYTEVTDGRLVVEMPNTLSLRWIIVFPEADKTEALKELGRLNVLLAESWDVSHAWIAGAHAEKVRYLGFHEEATHPEIIPEKLKALALTATGFQRGFVLFHRGLVEAVYPDTIPSPAEARPTELRTFAAPGQRTCVTFSLLPLANVKGLKVRVGDLASNAGGRIPTELRFSRYHQKCMEYGHHNHTFNYQEHFLVKRPRLDLYPGAAKRGYVEMTVPVDAKRGMYAGKVTITSAQGITLKEVTLTLDVLPIKLARPSTYFGTESSHALMRSYGLNLSSGDYNEALKNGFEAWTIWPYDATRPRIAGRRLGWSTLEANRDFLKALIEAGRSGKGMRLLFGGPFPGERYGGKRNEEIRKAFTGKMLAAFPKMDLVGITMPTYYYQGPGYAHSGYVWQRQIRTKGKPGLLAAARESGKEFWFVDWLRHSKEQPARFTFGFWLWKLGAIGKFTTFTYGGDYHYGTAKEAYPRGPEPYYTLLGVVGGNCHPALKASRVRGEMNPSRDLVLIGAGINDYRYIYTLDVLIAEAERKKRGGAALAAAKKFRDELAGELSLDLDTYYESRTASYAENWYPKADNPWTTAKFDGARRACAERILLLHKALGK